MEMMEKDLLTEKMKFLSKKCVNGQKVSAVEFGDQLYFVAESVRYHFLGDLQKDYYLFNAGGKHIWNLYISKIHMTPEQQEFEKSDGVVEVPEDFLLLTNIEILDPELQGKGIGSFFLNWMIKDIQNFPQKLPILFIRDNNKSAIAFYKKWEAECNQEVQDDKIGSSCYMKIKQPKTKDEYCGKVVGEYQRETTASKNGNK